MIISYLGYCCLKLAAELWWLLKDPKPAGAPKSLGNFISGISGCLKSSVGKCWGGFIFGNLGRYGFLVTFGNLNFSFGISGKGFSLSWGNGLLGIVSFGISGTLILRGLMGLNLGFLNFGIVSFGISGTLILMGFSFNLGKGLFGIVSFGISGTLILMGLSWI